MRPSFFCWSLRLFPLLQRPALCSVFFFEESIRENRKKQVVLPNEVKKKLEYLKKFLYYLNKKKRKNRKHNYTAQIFRKRGRYETTGNLIYYCLISCRSCTERVLLRTSDVTDCPYLLDLHRHCPYLHPLRRRIPLLSLLFLLRRFNTADNALSFQEMKNS